MFQPRVCRALRQRISLPPPSSSSLLASCALLSRPHPSTRAFSLSRRLSRCCSPSPTMSTMSYDSGRKPNDRVHRVVRAMQAMFPEKLADKAWDNVGLLLDSLPATERHSYSRVLLANDLTSRVADEAITYDVDIIIAYHPVIFRGLKSITLDDPQQASLLRLAQRNIAVYSPHTALDAAPGGINDWLADAVIDAAAVITNNAAGVVEGALKPVSSDQMTALQRENGYRPQAGLRGHRNRTTGELIAGYGRLVKFSHSVDVRSLVRGILENLGLLNDESDTASAASTLRHALVVRPRQSTVMHPATSRNGPAEGFVRSVAICAGSGADVMRGSSADLLLTGEMSHHDALAASARGQWVVCLLHSNSERLFLKKRLQPLLEEALPKNEIDSYPGATVLVSEADCDPFEIWDMSEPEGTTPADTRPTVFNL